MKVKGYLFQFYGPGNNRLKSFPWTEFSLSGFRIWRLRLGDKFSRFKTLSRLSANDAGQQQVTDESIRDTLMDLANYAIMTILEMDEEKGMETPDPNAASMAIGACSARSDIRAGLR